MGSMSASDAAPLPRLGEVYFDVRGESRSMRLSWYADTGVAVFSIWQGGTCTGTFRLPIADLPRMVQTLQRGPDGDAGSAGEQPAAGQAQRGGQAREPQPGVPVSDVGAGQAATAVHRSRGGRHHGDDRAQPGYARDPAGEYREEPTAGYLAGGYADEPGGGQSIPRRNDGYRDELTAQYPEKPDGGYSGSRRAGGYADEPGAGYSGSRRATHRAAYEDEPTGVYREDDPLYRGGGPGGGYEQEPTGPYPEAGPPRAYPGSGLPAAGPAYHDDGLPGRYEPEPPEPYPGDHPGRYEPERTAAYPAGRYEDEPAGVYHGDMPHEGYADEPGGRYPAGDSTGDLFTADYPAGRDYPGASDPRDHPAPAEDGGYSPARPYVGSGPGRAASPLDEGEPRHSRGRRDDDDPGPESFPYGAPSSERPARGRAR
jgi:hypothetical protein